MALYPLLFDSIYKDRVWGGQRIAEFAGRHLPEGRPIGEAWDVVDVSQVRNGPLRGWPLAELATRSGAALVGQRVWDRYGNQFPLLLKLIDAGQVLSVQVHPDDGQAQRQGEPWGKTECWYVLHADPGAELIHGFEKPVDRADLERAIRDDNLAQYLHRVPVSAGDAVYVPAGTVHAVGTGLLLYEVQQRSDTTYRLHDWGRLGFDGKPRELHIQQSLDVLDPTVWPEHKTRSLSIPLEDGRQYLVACRHFALELWTIPGMMRWEGDGESFNLLTAVDGTALLRYGEDGEDEVTFGPGETLLVPADLGWCLLETTDRCRILRAYVPDLWLDVVSPLLHAGVSPQDIRRLSGYGRQNDIEPLLVGR